MCFYGLGATDRKTYAIKENVEALKKLNRFVICGAVSCNDCTVESDEVYQKTICVKCAKELHFREIIRNDNDETVQVDFSSKQEKNGA